MYTLSGVGQSSSGHTTLVVVSCCGSGHVGSECGSDGINRETVRFADLNLASPRDVEELYRRIEYAARKVCVDHVRGWHDCYKQAVTNAVARIDRAPLTALHRSRTGAVT